MVASKIARQRRITHSILKSCPAYNQPKERYIMPMIQTDQCFFSRRAFLSMTGFGAMAAMTPAKAFAFLAQEYPTLRGQINGFIAAKKVAGIVAAIGHSAQAPEYISAGTLAIGDATPVDADSLFRVYSMTKPVTGMAAMILIDEGKMKLDQPIADFLPEFAEMRVATDPEASLDSIPAKTQITIRHLLTHTAGFGYSIISQGALLKAYLDNGITPGAVSRMPLPGFESGAPTPDLKSFAERVAKLPLIAEPGTRWSYSISLDLLGRVIEVVSGMSFDAFLQDRIFGPLKMASSYFQVPQNQVKRFATNYAVFGGALIPIDPAASSIYLDKPAFAFGGAGLVCSAHDYDRFLAMVLNGGSFDGATLMSPQTAALAVSNLLPVGTDTKGTFIDGQLFGAGGAVGQGDKEGSFGWSGAAGTVGFVNFNRKIRATGMIQYMPPGALPFQEDFQKWVVADLGNSR
jgi:CubicO group peptidase (beta-lactamase class C family)